jgi:hypothetical protein
MKGEREREGGREREGEKDRVRKRKGEGDRATQAIWPNSPPVLRTCRNKKKKSNKYCPKCEMN